MKWCTNCRAEKESWAEKLKDYKKYSDKQCWKCDKYALEERSVVVVSSEKTVGCNMRGGSWREDIYYKSDGSSTRTFIKTGNWELDEVRMVVEVPPKRSTSPCRII